MAAALVRPLRLVNAGALHLPLGLMVGSLLLVLALALPRGRLTRPAGIALMAAYPLFVVAVLVSR